METKTDMNSISIIPNDDGSICTHHTLKFKVSPESITAVNSCRNSYQCEECHQTCMVTFTGQFTESSSVATDDGRSKSSNSHYSEGSSTNRENDSDGSDDDDGLFERFKQLNLIDSNLSISDESVKSNQTASSKWLLMEFDYLNVILGEGKFGCVGKFRNKKDDQVYAIKKTSWTERNKREVQVLSTLQHDNIVRYYNSWTEPNDLSWPVEE